MVLTVNKLSLCTCVAICALNTSALNAATFNMEKNGTSFSVDGNGGAQEGQQLYLWATNTNNANQNWVQVSHGDGYYSYKKEGTSLCWDGGSGGAKRQAVTLEVCDSDDYNQHWKKIKITSGTEIYRFQKRNASGYSIDGNGGADYQQSLYLWSSSDTNVNQQWDLSRTDIDDDSGSGSTPVTGTAKYPSDLMDNYDQWKITYPDGEEDKTLYQTENEYFYVNDDNNGIVFYVPIRSDNGSTKNSDYIRSELRERKADGSSDMYWDTDGTHTVYVKQAITHLPIVKSHLVATQIHGNKDDGIDDAMVLRLEDEHLFLSFNGGKLRDDLTITKNYSLGTVHEIIFEVVNGKHYVYYSENGGLESAYKSGKASSYLVKDGSKSYVMDKDYDDAYFKVGNYTQSNSDKEGNYSDNSNNYGEVVVYDFWVDHD